MILVALLLRHYLAVLSTSFFFCAIFLSMVSTASYKLLASSYISMIEVWHIVISWCALPLRQRLKAIR